MPDKIFIIKTKIFPRVKRVWHFLLSSWLVRLLLLSIAALSGLWLAKHGGFELVKLQLINLTIASNRQLAILFMSLPVLFVLWLFRTYDTREQIQKTQENADAARDGVKATRDALNADTLGRYLSMLFSENLSARCVGLIRLAEIKRQGKFAEEIDSATRRQINLNEAKLQGEDLSGLDLRGAQLNNVELYDTILVGADVRYAVMCSAYLFSTKLMEADLRGVNFRGARFMDADLRGAKLQNADLIDTTDLKHAKLEGAEFSAGTKFPSGFDYDLKGMVRKNEP